MKQKEKDPKRFVKGGGHFHVTDESYKIIEELQNLPFSGDYKMSLNATTIFILGTSIGLFTEDNPPKYKRVIRSPRKEGDDHDLFIGTSFHEHDINSVLSLLLVSRHQDIASEDDEEAMSTPTINKLEDYFDVGIKKLDEFVKKNDNKLDISKLIKEYLPD